MIIIVVSKYPQIDTAQIIFVQILALSFSPFKLKENLRSCIISLGNV